MLTLSPLGRCVGLLVILSPAVGDADLFVFGDSLSDTGNTLAATTGTPLLPTIPDPAVGYVDGRFANGSIWIERTASLLGTAAPAPSRLGGTNFAHGGSSVLTSDLLQPSLFEQVANINMANASDWHFVWAGSGDLRAADPSDLSLGNEVAANTAAGVRANIDSLFDVGARQFVVLNQPALGSLPLATSTLSDQEQANLNLFSQTFNTELSSQLEAARGERPGIHIVDVDIHSLFEQAVADPAAFGLTNVTDAAAPFEVDGFLAGSATAVPGPEVDVDTYLFYDGIHPTAATHFIVGSQVAASIAAVPEPSSLALLTVAACCCMAISRRRFCR